MRQQFKSLAKSSLVYGLGNVIAKAMGFVLIILYTKHIPLADFGVLGLFESVLHISASILGVGIEYALLRWYWDDKFKDKQKSLVFTCFVFLLLCGLATVFAFWNTASYFSMKYFGSLEYTLLIRKLLIIIGFAIVSRLPLMLLRILEKPRQYTIANTVKFFSQFILTIYFVVYSQQGLNGIYNAQIISAVIFFFIMFKVLLNHIEFRLEFHELYDMIKFRLPSVFSTISLQILTTADRFVLKHLGKLDNVGVYTFGSKISESLKTLVVMTIWLGINPMIMKMMNDDNNKAFYSKLFTYGTMFVLSITFSLALFGREIVLVLSRNPDYNSAYSVLPFLFLAIVFDFMTKISTTGIQIVKKPVISATAIVVSSLINIGLNYLLIPFWGNNGAAIATLFSQFVLFLITYISSQRLYNIPYQIWKILSLILSSIILCSISYIYTKGLVIRLFLNIFLLMIYSLLLFKLKFISKRDVVEMKKLINKVRK